MPSAPLRPCSMQRPLLPVASDPECAASNGSDQPASDSPSTPIEFRWLQIALFGGTSRPLALAMFLLGPVAH
eukprot:3542307-Prymnesium_polylepis.1